MIPYDVSVEQEMRKFYDTLSEKDKRRYAAIEALKLGHGGTVYISQVLKCSRKTITKGIGSCGLQSEDILCITLKNVP